MLLEKDLIFINKSFENRNKIFEYLNSVLLEKKYVKDSFLDGIIKREENYPTGLQTPVCGIAIPHTDSEHINEEKLVILTLDEPVEFENMDGSSNVEVKIVIMMLIKGGDNQIYMLQRLFSMFLENNKIEIIKNATNKEDVIGIMNEEGIF